MAGFVERLRARLAGLQATQSQEIHRVRGFPVVVENSRPDIATPIVLERLDEALALIESYQPARFRHLQRDLTELWVARFPCRGAYFPDSGRCLTELTFLARRDISAAVVASSILHEGVHARVDRFRERFGSRSDRDPAREERLCRRAELEFGQALPPDLGEPVVQRAQESLALADSDVAPAVDWEVARARQEAVDREAAAGPGPPA